MASSQGSRSQPLMCLITTAGFYLKGYPLYDYTETCQQILSGLKQDDEQFAMLYSLDEGDAWDDESVWIKANPSLGSTVSYEYMRSQINAAKNNTSLEIGVKTKNLNLWCESAMTWISQRYLMDSMKRVNLDDYPDEFCYGGVDLSAVSDLTAFSIMFPPNEDRENDPDKYIFKTWVYLPSEALETSVNAQLYKQWIKEGYLIVTSGNVVDYDYILRDQLKVNDKNYIQQIGFDSWNSTQWSINATNEGLQLFPYSQSLGNFNRPTKLFEILLKSDKIIIDYNPVVLWAFANVELKYDWNENCKPVKSANDQNKKIDPVISMLESLGSYLLCNQGTPEVTAI